MITKRFLELTEWNANHSSVWREIVSRFGQADYNDETLREKHKATLKAEWDALDYARKRQQEYPDLQECIHAILDDDLTALQAKRKLVKDKYPKPT
jgi:hypothetical protein